MVFFHGFVSSLALCAIVLFLFLHRKTLRNVAHLCRLARQIDRVFLLLLLFLLEKLFLLPRQLSSRLVLSFFSLGADQVISKPQLLLVPQEESSSPFSSSSSCSSFPKSQAIAWQKRLHPSDASRSGAAAAPSSLHHTLVYTCTDTGRVNIYDLNKNSNLQCQSSKTTGKCSTSFSAALHRLKTMTYGGGVTIAEGTMEIFPIASIGIGHDGRSDLLVSGASSSSSFSLNDIQVHPRFSSVVGTAGEDGRLRIFDIRQPVQAYSIHRLDTHLKKASSPSSAASASSTSPSRLMGRTTSSLTGEGESREQNPGPSKNEKDPPSPSSSGVSTGVKLETREAMKKRERVYFRRSPSSFASDKENVEDGRGGGSTSALNCLSFNAYNENVVGVGTADGVVSLWDLRYTSHSLMDLLHHTSEITSLHFSPSSSSLLASSSTDGDVAIWDFSRPHHQSKVCILRSPSSSPPPGSSCPPPYLHEKKDASQEPRSFRSPGGREIWEERERGVGVRGQREDEEEGGMSLYHQGGGGGRCRPR